MVITMSRRCCDKKKASGFIFFSIPYRSSKQNDHYYNDIFNIYKLNVTSYKI